MKKTYKIDVECAACADKMERAAQGLEGVKDLSINFIMGKIKVEFEEGADPNSVMNAVRESCRKIEPACDIDFN